MLKIENLKASVDNKSILKGLNLEVMQGKSTQLWGQMELVKVR